MKEIELQRKKIDKINKKLLELLNERAKTVQKIGKLKKTINSELFVPEREEKLLKKLEKENKGLLSKEQIRNIFREIISASIALQGNIKIAFLGPRGTFTEEAALKRFGKSIKLIPIESIPKIFETVEQKKADYGVIPIENSLNGSVITTLKELIKTNLKIYTEIIIDIKHNLVSKEKSLKTIKRIYSHSQALNQCKKWLQANLDKAKLIECSSTAKAAEIVAKEKNSAAISSLNAAKKNKLNVLAKNIQDLKVNKTRFIVIGKNTPKKTGNDKTSIILTLKHKPGELFKALKIFKEQKINLTKIESRSIGEKPWHYYFFIDFEGHLEEKKVKKALNKLKEISLSLEILGSYPKQN